MNLFPAICLDVPEIIRSSVENNIDKILHFKYFQMLLLKILPNACHTNAVTVLFLLSNHTF